MGDIDRPLFVTLRLRDRSVLEHVVEQYSCINSDVETITIVDPSQEDTEPLSIEISHITQKQWEALEVAHEFGHYTSHRGGNLEEIAIELDISKSAASQRLRAAEAKIVSAILGTDRVKTPGTG